MNLFLDSLSSDERAFLVKLKEKSYDLLHEPSLLNVHDCGHDDGNDCKNYEVL